jgi:hypothetical protein
MGDKLPVLVQKTAFKAANRLLFGKFAGKDCRSEHTNPARMREIPLSWYVGLLAGSNRLGRIWS